MNQVKTKNNRQGVAAVEFALVVPILLFLVFACLEFSRANLIRNICANAAMEGAREGIVPGATSADCIARTNDLIDSLGLENAVVQVTPAVILPTTEEVIVSVSVPLSDNTLTMSQFVLGKNITQSVTLPREYDY